MFGLKKENAVKSKNPSSASGRNTFNSLVQGTSISGDITADSDIRIDGKLTGNLECAAKVVIGPTGSVEGEIRCENAVIEGRFKGTIKVNQLLQVKENAEVNGNISTDKIVVQSGAIFNVVCQMGKVAVEKNKGASRKSDAKQFLRNAQPVS